MAVILDHITAILVGTSLLGVLIFVQQRGQQTAVDNSIHHSVQTQSFSIAETLERDLENIRNSDISGQRAHVQRSGGNTSVLRFVTLEDPSLGETSPLIAVAYRLEDTYQQVLVNGTPETVYRLGRYVNDGSGFTFKGGSTETLTGFDASLVSRDMGSVVTSGYEPDDFAVVQIELESAVAGSIRLASDQTSTSRSNQTRKGFTFRPPALAVEIPPGGSSTITTPSPWPDLPDAPYIPEPDEGEGDPDGEGEEGETDDGPGEPGEEEPPPPPPPPPPPDPDPPPFEI